MTMPPLKFESLQGKTPQTPGGASDAIARLLAQALSERWHQSVVVENKGLS